MKFNDYDVVKLIVNFGKLSADSQGTIVMSYEGFPENIYTVEFLNYKGESLGFFDIEEKNLVLVWEFKK